MSIFDPSVFWPAFKEDGMLCTATVTSGGDTFAVDVCYSAPDRPRFNDGALSREHQIEYQHADAPVLAQGDVLSIVDPDGNAIGSFRVRSAPEIADGGNASDGYFRVAILTKT